jgi:catalase
MWYSKKGEYVWVKYHFKSEQHVENLTAEEADRMKSSDPDHATRDLFAAIQRKEYPSWRLEVQIMTPEQAQEYRFDPFDITKVWYHSDFPPITIGRMVLNRNPENYFNDVEQSAFSPANFVPGIGPSPDKLLQGRLFSYSDTHRYRLGPNYHLLPVNAPKGTAAENYQRDAAMNSGPAAGYPNYYPNTQGGAEPDPQAAEPAVPVSGKAMRQEYSHPNDDFVQAGDLFRRAMTDSDREHLVLNIVGHLSHAQKRFRLRQTALFFKADPEYGRRVAEGLGLKMKEVESLAKMSQEQRVKATLG